MVTQKTTTQDTTQDVPRLTDLELLQDGIQACLRGSAPVAPLAAAILVLCAPPERLTSTPLFGLDMPLLAIGVLDLLLGWGVVAVLYYVLGLSHVRRANASTYCDLRNQLCEMRGTYEAVIKTFAAAAHNSALPVEVVRAQNQFEKYTSEVDCALSGGWGRTVWALGMGYVSAWQMLHRAQEALINIEPLGALVERAEYDRLRLAGSTVEGHAYLRDSLTAAVSVVSPLVTSESDMTAIGDLYDVLRLTDKQLGGLAWSEPLALSTVAGELQRALSVLQVAPLPLAEKMALYSALRAAQTRLSTAALQPHTNGAAPVESVAQAAGGGVAVATGANGATTATPPAAPPAWPEVDVARAELRAFLTGAARASQPVITQLAGTPGALQQLAAAVTTTTSTAQLTDPHSVGEARTVIGTVRQTLNAHRDDSRAGLVRARTELACTTVVTGLLAYGLLWLVRLAGASAENLQAGAAFFIIAALISLFSRLYSDFGTDTATDDFGLSAMRQLSAPQLSGVAGVVGVALVAFTSNMNNPSAMSVLGAAFQLPAAPMYYLSAAIFGLAPGLLIDRLKQQTEQFKTNLRTSEPQRGQASVPFPAHA